MPATFAIQVEAAKKAKSWQLALDKFPFNLKRPDRQSLTCPDEKGREQSIKPSRLREIVGRYNDARSDLERALERQQQFLGKLALQHGDRFRRVSLVNSSRLLLHLGRANVLENVGLYCERISGLPIIPGSALKGVVSTWACWEEHFEEAEGSFRDFSETSVQRKTFQMMHASQILGDNSSTGSTEAGSIVFLGAFPATLPKLGLDIVTPHHDAAGNDRDPTPNPFLCIEPGAEWQFGMIATSRSGIQCPKVLDLAQSWIIAALEQGGVGAKTAAGYGRFVNPGDWETLTMDAETRRMHAETRAAEAQHAAQSEAFRASLIGDYTETTFKGAVLDLLVQPNKGDLLRREIERLRNPANASWIPRLTDALRGKEMRDHRNRLKQKDWFPKEWLPQ